MRERWLWKGVHGYVKLLTFGIRELQKCLITQETLKLEGYSEPWMFPKALEISGRMTKNIVPPKELTTRRFLSPGLPLVS